MPAQLSRLALLRTFLGEGVGMINSRNAFICLLITILFTPAAGAQDIYHSFDDLRSVLRLDERTFQVGHHLFACRRG